MRAQMRDGEQGATAVEYAIMAALIAAVIFGTVGLLGEGVRNLFADPQLLEALTP